MGARCSACGCSSHLERDHVNPTIPVGDPRREAPANKRWLCRCPEHGCHDRIGARRDRPRGIGGRIAGVDSSQDTLAPKRTPTKGQILPQIGWRPSGRAVSRAQIGWPRIVHVVGQPGSGKTTLASRLALDTDTRHLDIADQPGHLVDSNVAWQHLHAAIGNDQRVIVESVGTLYAHRYRGDMAIICWVPADVRRARLELRPEAHAESGYVERMLAIGPPVVNGLRWDGRMSFTDDAYSSLLVQAREYLNAAVREPSMTVIG